MYLLQERGAGAAKLVDIARSLGLSRSTVSERLSGLARQGYVTHVKYEKPALTRRGETLARKLTRKHRIVEVFLHEVLKMPKGRVHAEAHKLEHALSDEVVERLGRFLGNPKVDAHGAPIPSL